MAWNEPGNKGGNPWGSPPSNNNNKGNGNDLQDLLAKLSDLLGSGGSDGGGEQMPASKLIALAMAAVIALWAAMGVYQLDEQQRAVVLRFGAFKEIIGSGVHWNPPIIDTVITENVTRQRSYTSQGVMLTEDTNIVDVKLSVQYTIGDLRAFTLSIRDPERALAEATDSALRHAVGSSKMDDVLTTGLDKIGSDVRVRLQQYLDTYQTGIVVTTINLEKPQPPAAVQAAFDDVIKAREDEQRVQNEAKTYANGVIPEARGLATRVREESLAYRERVIARAQGEATRFEALLTEYRKAPDVTRTRLYLEAVEEVMANNSKVMIDAKSSGNMLYLPLDQLRNGAKATSTSSSASSMSQSEIDAISAKIEEKLRRETGSNRVDSSRADHSRADSSRNREIR
jgi:membrane protease subunit HflK